MSFAYFIAHRLRFSDGRVSPPAIRIAIAGIAIGLTVMILTVAIVVGFKSEIRKKVVGFGGHLQVHAMDYNRTYETIPIAVSDSLVDVLKGVDGVTALSLYITKPAVLKTPDSFLAVVIKGVGEGCIPQSLKAGNMPEGEREIVVSQTISDKMKLKVGDKASFYFIRADQNADLFAFGAEDMSVKARQLTIAGIYDTGFEEYDSQLVYGSLEMLQAVNGWDEDMASGIEVNVEDFSEIEDTGYEMILALRDKHDRRGTAFHVQTIREINPQIFSWLDLLDTNVWVILILMAVVASFTMISGLLIIILERTSMIGILKAMGCDNFQLRQVFLYVATLLIGKGLVIGNILGIAVCLVQKYFHLVTLDPKNYYLEWVPISLNFVDVLAINIGTIIISLLVLFVPSSLVARISPVKTIHSE